MDISSNHTWARGEGTVPPPLIRRIGGKISGPIRILTAKHIYEFVFDYDFVFPIRIRIRISTFSPVDVFFGRQ